MLERLVVKIFIVLCRHLVMGGSVFRVIGASHTGDYYIIRPLWPFIPASR